MPDDDLLIFVDDALPFSGAASPVRPKWKIAVIDDDPSVHDGTRFALYDYSLNGHGIEILSAHSAVEGRRLLEEHPDIAVILLDVVMETDTAGLDLVSTIRRELKNEAVRIILRTGQPGQAPERSVIVDYDINDYKAKTELTSTKLFTAVTAALRGFQQLQRMIATRRGLEIIIDATETLYNARSIQRLAEGVLTQISSLLDVTCAGILALRRRDDRSPPFAIVAGSGCYSTLVGPAGHERLEAELVGMLNHAFEHRLTEFHTGRTLLYIAGGSETEVVVLLESDKSLSDTDRTLIEVFCSRIAVSLENVTLYDQLQEINRSLEARVRSRTQELAAANLRLQEQWQRARRAGVLQNEVLGTVAHDLKNPLSVIMGRTEILKELIGAAGLDFAPGLAQIEHVRASTARLIGMTDDLVKSAMEDAHDITIRRGAGDLATLVGEVVEANRLLAARKEQVIQLNAASMPQARFDYDRLREALDNLVGNAVKYSPIGGRIDVTVRPGSEEAVITISDQGPGLLPEDHSRLFGRFQRLSAKPTGGETSTGLGLSIAKRIVDLHEGAITAESPGAGQGSTFTVRLPLDPGA